MRTRTTAAAAVAAALLLATLTACGKSVAEQRADCRAALTKGSTKTNRPEACADLSQQDYDRLLLDWVVESAVKDMPQESQDRLDYHDDGELNGSILD
ncbi:MULTISPECIES: hypothetical protein [Streptomyces]|uniref:Uncharacterized protein n=2 Tax=Streptomyces TaxID=1883 RepID=A0A100Y639_9ACTN|nr:MULTISPECIES: hypothetical protein [Streptomyces]KUH38397.1 hypothetical protein ATE80_13085 [Streptomyces kanasensis]UUS30843.1 hypothetical protein NRO40_08335 [Streptomyces changanensis]